jgi:hypothetical protein
MHPSIVRSGAGHFFPATHARHVPLPAWLVLPFGHGVIELLLESGHLYPAGHDTHEVKPYPEMVPAAQANFSAVVGQ